MRASDVIKSVDLSSSIPEKEIVPDKILSFPDARQSTNYSCGLASLQSILYYYGIDIREGELIKKVGALPTVKIHSGVDPDVLVDQIKSEWGLKVDKKVNMSIQDIKNYIDKDIPVILAIQAWKYENNKVNKDGYKDTYKDGHYIVAIGYTDNEIIFDDPSIMSNKAYLDNSELLDRWHDKDYNGNEYEKLGIAVYGRKPYFNPGKMKKIL